MLGRTCYPDLQSIPRSVEVVDIFRKPDDVILVVEVAITIGARAVWLHEGIVNDATAARARQAGLLVVTDRCMLKEHQLLTGGKTILSWQAAEEGGVQRGEAPLAGILRSPEERAPVPPPPSI